MNKFKLLLQKLGCTPSQLIPSAYGGILPWRFASLTTIANLSASLPDGMSCKRAPSRPSDIDEYNALKAAGDKTLPTEFKSSIFINVNRNGLAHLQTLLQKQELGF